ncbi:antitoxin VbhA family protein [Thioalkalivibrio sp. ALE20]|nr:antitoxin VbhA family protein [Thioalkalivibrio sp. ALE20]
MRRSRANVRLEGLHADPRTEALVAAMARGEINADKAVGEIRSWYAGRT